MYRIESYRLLLYQRKPDSSSVDNNFDNTIFSFIIVLCTFDRHRGFGLRRFLVLLCFCNLINSVYTIHQTPAELGRCRGSSPAGYIAFWWVAVLFSLKNRYINVIKPTRTLYNPRVNFPDSAPNLDKRLLWRLLLGGKKMNKS